eukprot:CAMPEP_0194369828 /NCGR_PEP_ID=MMETSP0174-20130528/18186_1 /TAXON_ID=216777 /ORGANISM="Proboscia alata, Strain PI-D3" /LENGTH=77 /DNA_ID=CAMNT_0039147009 /DNA_START=12 /DNA_END=245 /DNA_ORIENTATION=-
MRTSGSSVYMSPSIMFFRIVDVTDAPRSMAPKNSQIAAIITACFRLRDLADTDVAKAFATLLAPIPKAIMKPKIPAA